MFGFTIDTASTGRAAARGLVAAMAMTGMRSVSSGLGLLEQTPPEAIVEEQAGDTVAALSPEHRAVVAELAHWGFGAAAGSAFGMLPASLRRHTAAGPAYGLAIWLAFEFAIAPLLGVRRVVRGRFTARAMIALDHVLYGVVVAGRLAPEPGARRETLLPHFVTRRTR